MWLLAAFDKDTLAWIAGVLLVIGPLLSGIRAVIDGFSKFFGGDTDKKPEKLLTEDRLTQSDKALILKELKLRKKIILGMAGLMSAALFVGYFLYRDVVPAKAKLPNQLAIKSVKPIDPEDAWIKTHRAFTPLVSSLMPVITDQPGPNFAGAKNSQVISIQTGEFGEYTSKHPTETTTRLLRYPVADYKFQPPYVFLLKKTASGEAFQGLAVSDEKDGWKFTIPEAEAKDSLFIIGQLVHVRDATIPSDLSTTFQIVEVAK